MTNEQIEVEAAQRRKARGKSLKFMTRAEIEILNVLEVHIEAVTLETLHNEELEECEGLAVVAAMAESVEAAGQETTTAAVEAAVAKAIYDEAVATPTSREPGNGDDGLETGPLGLAASWYTTTAPGHVLH